MTNINLLPDERLDKINERLTLIQKTDGLTFGTDAYLLAAFVNTRGAAAAELGAGTGVASLLLAARDKASRITAVEIQPDFVSLCERNAKLNGFSDRIVPLLRDVRELIPADTDGEVDIVISNPPYMQEKNGRGNVSDAKNIARREIYGGIADFCAAAARVLKYGGDFYTVYRPDRLCDLIFSLKEHGLEPKRLILVYPRADREPCLALVRSRKGGKAGVNIAPPLVIYREPGTPADFPIPDGEKDLGYTAEFARVYADFSLEHMFAR